MVCHMCHTSDPDAIDAISDGGNTEIVRCNSLFALTTRQSDLGDRVWLIKKIDDHSGTTPFRMYCKKCDNQLGVLVYDGRRYIPSFQNQSVTFVSVDGNKLEVNAWKKMYATEIGFIRYVTMRTSKHVIRSYEREISIDPLCYDSKSIEVLRIKRGDPNHETKANLVWNVESQGYDVIQMNESSDHTYKSSVRREFHPHHVTIARNSRYIESKPSVTRAVNTFHGSPAMTGLRME
jgi:hypothetical protein